MSGAPKKSGPGFLSRLLAPVLAPLALVSSRGVVCLALLAGLPVAMYAGWRWFGPQVEADPSYALTADKIEITPQPEWIRCDVRAEVAEYALAEPRDLRDPELTVQFAQAFAMHPWVANVRRVSKSHPARIVLDLEYRQPVAMVEVVSQDGKHWLYPVDAAGVLLPTKDFTPERALAYPRINAGDTMYTGPAGTAWGDRRVHGAALIAAALSPHWHRLGLYRITAVDDQRPATLDPQPIFELSTRAGSRIRWGHPPGAETATEPKCEQKIQQILAYAQENSGLHSSDRSTVLNLLGSPPPQRGTTTLDDYGHAAPITPGAQTYPDRMSRRQAETEQSPDGPTRTGQEEGLGVGSGRVSPF